jgi:hypothetical protein
MSSFMEICPVGGVLMHADRQEDRHDEVMGAFHAYASAPKNGTARDEVIKERAKMVCKYCTLPLY